MPETLILNPKPGFDPDLGDSFSPNYGFQEDEPDSRLYIKTPGGYSYSREISNEGRTFTFGWTKRPRTTIERLKQIARQTEDGYFTIIDHDGGGRHFVGNFTGPTPTSQDSNNSHSAQGWKFVEAPGAPMVQYPTNWERWSIPYYALNDRGANNAATSGANWTTVNPSGIALDDPFYATLSNTGKVAGDSMQMEYRGYGFQLWLHRGPAFGQVQVVLDGTPLTAGNTTGAAPVNGTFDLYAAQDGGPQLVVELAMVSLDLHRVKIVLLGTKNAAATAAGMIFDHMQVMR